MEEHNINSLKDLLGKDLEAFPKKPEEPVAGPSTSTSEWLSLPASQGNKESSFPARSIPQEKKKHFKKHFKPISVQGCTHGDHLYSLGWESHERCMNLHWEAQSGGNKVWGNGAPLIKKRIILLFKAGPCLCSPIFLQGSKIEVPSRCQRCVQRWPSHYWARYQLPVTYRRHPHTRGLPCRSRQRVK